MMDIREAIDARHTVRKYLDMQVAPVTVFLLNERIAKLNRLYGLNVRLLTNVSSYHGKAPDWFTEGVQAAMQAPTPRNRQRFLITGRDEEVSIESDDGEWSEIVSGIVRYYFEVGAGRNALL